MQLSDVVSSPVLRSKEYAICASFASPIFTFASDFSFSICALILPNTALLSPSALPYCTAVSVRLRSASYCNRVICSAPRFSGCRLLSFRLSLKLPSAVNWNTPSLLLMGPAGAVTGADAMGASDAAIGVGWASACACWTFSGCPLQAASAKAAASISV